MNDAFFRFVKGEQDKYFQLQDRLQEEIHKIEMEGKDITKDPMGKILLYIATGDKYD